MNTQLILMQVLVFLKVFTLLICVVGVLFGVWFFATFKYKIELNKKTGSGILIKRYYARKLSDRNGNYRLSTVMGGKSFLYPNDDLFLYKDGFFWLVRFYQKAENDYHPISLIKRLVSTKAKEKHQEQLEKRDEVISYIPTDESKEELVMKVIPQNIKFIYKTSERAIQNKYEKQKDFMQQYGQIIGLGMIAIAFIIGIYFIMNHVQSAIDLGNQALALAKQLQPNTIQSASPP